MTDKFKARKIGVSALCRVSAAGGSGIYLYIPKNFADVYGLVGTDYVQVFFSKAFKKVYEKADAKVVDLTSRKKKLPQKATETWKEN